MMAWLALGIVAALFGVVFVLRAAIQVRRTGDSGMRRDGFRARVGSAEWFGAWLFVVAIVAAFAAPIAELAGLSPWIESRSTRVVGAVIATIGSVLVFAAQLNMGDNWRVGVDAKEKTELVSVGWFRIVRNPVFSAFVVTAIGLTIMVCNPISLLGLAAFIASIEVQVRFVEEPYLLATHPNSYPAYAARVGRFVPFVGRLSAE